MSIINVTTDSFYEKSRAISTLEVTEKAGESLDEGAKIIDIGGQSTRPGAEIISPQEEIDRVIPAIEAISKHFPEAIISVDTFRGAVATQAIKAGAHWINDVSGGQLDPTMLSTIALLNVPYILMHMRGTPQTMINLTDYPNGIVTELLDYFGKKIKQLKDLNCHDIIIDPGFGFAKNAQQNFYLLNKLPTFSMLSQPILVGISRKSFIYKTLGCTPNHALYGTTALHMTALRNGANILRVHDAKPAQQAVNLFLELNSNN